MVRRSCSNPLTCFAHVDRCALPGIGELACMMILHTLTDIALQFGRCKTRAKTVAIQDSGGEIQKLGRSISRSISSSRAGLFHCGPRLVSSAVPPTCRGGSVRGCTQHAAYTHACCLTDVGGRWPAAIVLRHRRRPEEASKQYPGEAPYTNRGLRHVGEAPLTNRGSVPRDDL